MRAAGARLDAYAHHPYPIKPKETPWSGRLRGVSEPDDGVARSA
jgi:hypothetical protein